MKFLTLVQGGLQRRKRHKVEIPGSPAPHSKLIPMTLAVALTNLGHMVGFIPEAGKRWFED